MATARLEPQLAGPAPAGQPAPEENARQYSIYEIEPSHPAECAPISPAAQPQGDPTTPLARLFAAIQLVLLASGVIALLIINSPMDDYAFVAGAAACTGAVISTRLPVGPWIKHSSHALCVVFGFPAVLDFANRTASLGPLRFELGVWQALILFVLQMEYELCIGSVRYLVEATAMPAKTRECTSVIHKLLAGVDTYSGWFLTMASLLKNLASLDLDAISSQPLTPIVSAIFFEIPRKFCAPPATPRTEFVCAALHLAFDALVWWIASSLDGFAGHLSIIDLAPTAWKTLTKGSVMVADFF